jgi:predicted ABC-type transport system involved in lysophospholipase L1 biosynthesis ATPase subunit
MNVLENVVLPGMVDVSIASWPGARVPARKRAIELLESLGLGERLKHKPKELSGGERQRVAIARALMNRPKVLLADEPTGNLDSRTGKQIMEVLLQTNRDQGQTILMVTHDQSLASQAHQIMHLRDGKMVTS